jgi:cytochrome bd-type quinol oxidase subunit 2
LTSPSSAKQLCHDLDMKKQTTIALVLLLLIPIVLVSGGLLFSAINPEMAAGHPNYVRNDHLLSLMKTMTVLASVAIAGVLWVLACFLVIRSKERSLWWLFFASLGPIGFAILALLNDAGCAETGRYERFVRSLSKFVRLGYEVCSSRSYA